VKHALVALGLVLTIAAWFTGDHPQAPWIKPALFWGGIAVAVAGLIIEIKADRRRRKFKAFQ
jgi:hypothetical protein